jgi:hypothetical protein
MEDRQGFEPWVELSSYNPLAGDPNKPLWHLSVVLFWWEGEKSNLSLSLRVYNPSGNTLA